MSLKPPARLPIYIRAELWLVVSPTQPIPDNQPRGSRDKQGMGEEVRAKAAAMACSSDAASPGAAVELGQAPACSFVSQRRGLAAWACSSLCYFSHTAPSSARRNVKSCSFHREDSNSTSNIPVSWQGGSKSHSCFHGPNSSTALAAAPSPTSHQLSGLAAMDDAVKDAATPLSYCCLCGGCRVSSLKGLSPAHENHTQHFRAA